MFAEELTLFGAGGGGKEGPEGPGPTVATVVIGKATAGAPGATLFPAPAGPPGGKTRLMSGTGARLGLGLTLTAWGWRTKRRGLRAPPPLEKGGLLAPAETSPFGGKGADILAFKNLWSGGQI